MACRPNIWPDGDLPQLRPAFQALGRLLVEVGRLVVDLCDEYVQSQVRCCRLWQAHEIRHFCWILQGCFREAGGSKSS